MRFTSNIVTNAITIATTIILIGIALPNEHRQLITSTIHNGLFLEFFNTKGRGLRGEPFNRWRGSAIAVLIPTSVVDLEGLCLTLRSLDSLSGDDPNAPMKSPVLIFNEGSISPEERGSIMSCSDRPIAFPYIQLTDTYPVNFDHEKEWNILSNQTYVRRLPGREKWGYSVMVKFWTSDIWKHPAVRQFDTIMRVNIGSCFLKGEMDENPGYKIIPRLSDDYVYQSNKGGVGSNKFIGGLYDFAVKHMEREDITPSHPDLWDVIQTTWEREGNLPVFQTNFEIARLSFFQRSDVRRWHEALTESEPFGVWRKQWSDAQTRYFTMAMFGTDESVLVTQPHGYAHGKEFCAEYKLDHSETREKGDRSAVAALVPNNDGDLEDFCLALKSLSFLPGDADKPAKSPVLVFNEGNLSPEQKEKILECTDHPITFPIINFNRSYPEGFDAEIESKKFGEEAAAGVFIGRQTWGYAQMIRFWTTRIWKHPIIQKFDTVMRIDTDSCFLNLKKNPNPGYTDLPGLAKTYVYHSHFQETASNKFIVGLYNFTLNFMEKEGIVPSYPELWAKIEETMKKEETLPVFQTNFEVNRRTFFQREDVMKWHEALTELEPYGVFRKRWGDAQTRVLTMALFATEESVHMSENTGYVHGRGKCAETSLAD